MNAAEYLSNASSGIVNAAASRAHRLVDRTKQRVAPLLQRAAGAAHRTIDKVTRRAAPIARRVSENGTRAGTKAAQLADVCSKRVRARPLLSACAALAAGYCLGKLLRR